MCVGVCVCFTMGHGPKNLKATVLEYCIYKSPKKGKTGVFQTPSGKNPIMDAPIPKEFREGCKRTMVILNNRPREIKWLTQEQLVGKQRCPVCSETCAVESLSII